MINNCELLFVVFSSLTRTTDGRLGVPSTLANNLSLLRVRFPYQTVFYFKYMVFVWFTVSYIRYVYLVKATMEIRAKRIRSACCISTRTFTSFTTETKSCHSVFYPGTFLGGKFPPKSRKFPPKKNSNRILI